MALGAAIFGPEGQGISDWEKGFFAEYQPLGFILFARNVDNPDQLRRLTDDLRAAAGHDALVMIDQEGGRVERLKRPHWREWVSPLAEVARAADPARAMALRYEIIGRELRAVGIDVNAVPCADLVRDDTHPFLRNRCYSDQVDQVIAISRAVAQGCMAAGVLPVMKHMPGHGLAKVDSHLDLPHVGLPERMLRQLDFATFKGLATLPMGMTAHVVYDGLGEDQPATQSAEMIRRVREDLGFDGLLMTDDIGMEALSGGVAERSEAAMSAGCDVVLHSNGQPQEIEQVARVCGALEGPALVRARTVLQLRPEPTSVDISALEAEFEALTGAAPG